MTKSFAVGDQVYYRKKRVRGTVTQAFYDGAEDRYHVKTRLDVWSVPGSQLEMQSDGNKFPEISGSENDENDDSGAGKGAGA